MKNCWIIGASHGIGRELTKQLFKKGYDVIISARFADELHNLECELKKEYDESKNENLNSILVSPCDVSDLESLKKSWHDLHQKYSKIDLVIFASALYQEATVKDFDLGLSKKILDVNLGGFLNLLHLVQSGLKNHSFSHIVAVASVAGYFGMPKSLTYGASKAAMINLCEGIYPELKSHKIALSVVNPGFVKTRLTDQNKFSMPFLISAEKAASEIIQGIEAKKFEIHFPKKFTILLKLIRLLPYCLLLPILQIIYSNSNQKNN